MKNVYRMSWRIKDQDVVGGEGYRDKDILGLAFGNKSSLVVYQSSKGGLKGMAINVQKSAIDKETLKKVGVVGQLNGLATAACACPTKACAEAGLSAFNSVFQEVKNATVPNKQLAKLKSASAKTATCLVKLGITQQQLENALK